MSNKIKPLKTKKEIKEEEQIKTLCASLSNRGITVRRENLTRGQAFRVRSGKCLFSGERVVFVDRRLPLDQQLAVLLDYAGLPQELEEKPSDLI